jgi:hypothetical protein
MLCVASGPTVVKCFFLMHARLLDLCVLGGRVAGKPILLTDGLEEADGTPST